MGWRLEKSGEDRILHGREQGLALLTEAIVGKSKDIVIPADAPGAADVSRRLREIGTLLELTGDGVFKVRAYETAAQVIEMTGGDLHDRVRGGTLMELKGIGKGISEKITELVTTGRLGYYEDLAAKVPAGLRDMLRIPGLGPKKAIALHEALPIGSIGELEYACRENRLVELAGFGAKSQENILHGIELLKKYSQAFLIDVALRQAEELIAALREVDTVQRADVCGSLRRRKEIVRDLDLLVAAEDGGEAVAAFTEHPSVEHVTSRGETKASVRLASGMQADLRVVAPASYACALAYFTGSKEHNVALGQRALGQRALRQRAQGRKWKLNEYGLFSGKRRLAVADEEALYKKLKLAYIPPELRENAGEIEAAEAGTLPELLTYEDITGTFHMHTIASDGANTIEQLAEAAREMGWSYIGIADHSRSAAYAGGLSADALRAQREEIDAFNRGSEFRIFSGVESDILDDGSLDYDDDVLGILDFVIASVHSGFKMNRERMTARIVRAVAHPATTMLGHPTGRLLLAREPYAVDVDAVLEACAEHNVIVEINAHPQRLDLDWRYLRRAKELGILIAINPDAHSIDGLADVAYGVGVARKGWLEKGDVLNARAVGEVASILKRKKG